LRYGIPEFKMEKAVLDRRLAVMRESGVDFFHRRHVGDDGTPSRRTATRLRRRTARGRFDAPRLIPVPGADLEGVYPAMTYLEAANRAVDHGPSDHHRRGGRTSSSWAVGDTGADCLGTVHRQGAASVVQIEILDRPPDERPPIEPWPTMARIFKTSAAHAEGRRAPLLDRDARVSRDRSRRTIVVDDQP
jgi:glutamate synthase (NADPH/NADH) small chain